MRRLTEYRHSSTEGWLEHRVQWVPGRGVAGAGQRRIVDAGFLEVRRSCGVPDSQESSGIGWLSANVWQVCEAAVWVETAIEVILIELLLYTYIISQMSSKQATINRMIEIIKQETTKQMQQINEAAQI